MWHEIIWTNVGWEKIWESKGERLLGLNIDRN